jgi:uncharacterized protein YdeI (YjbR/CyaY-like superfamily)
MKVGRVTVYNAGDFGKWLEKNYAKESRVEVVVYKRHTGKPAPTHRELIEEALCYGWIDTTIKRLDENRFVRNFAKRTEKSTWSDNTLSYAKKLVQEGRMKPQGLKFYKLGLAKPVHDDGIPKNPSMPKELQEELAKKKNAKAKAVFEEFPPSTKKMLYRWILSGKQQETRAKRIGKIIIGAKVGNRNVILSNNN